MKNCAVETFDSQDKNPMIEKITFSASEQGVSKKLMFHCSRWWVSLYSLWKRKKKELVADKVLKKSKKTFTVFYEYSVYP